MEEFNALLEFDALLLTAIQTAPEVPIKPLKPIAKEWIYPASGRPADRWETTPKD